MNELISRQAAIDAIEEYSDRLQMVIWKENPGVPYKVHALNWCVNTIRELPSAQPEQQWIPVTEEEVFQAGYEGREIRFRVNGRLFVIRELAQ